MSQSSTLKWVLVGENRTGAAFKGAASGLDTLATKSKTVGKNLSLWVTAPLAGIAVAGVKTAADFGVTMASLEVNARDSMKAAGVSLDDMRGLALKMGADTVYSANESAMAMLELSKAGVSTSDIMGGALAGAMNLAATEGIDLGESATIVSNALNTFGLRGEDATRVADLLAAGAVASSAGAQDLAAGLKYVGSSAAALDIPMADTVTALAALNNAGLDASTAGTALNNFLLGMVPTTGKAQKAMKELGIEFKATDGSLKPMPQVLDEMGDAMEGMSAPERTKYLRTIFGKQGMRAANVLLAEGKVGWEEMSTAVTKQGVAQELADARMSGMAGALEQLSGSLETAALTIGESLAPIVESLAGKIQGLVNRFTELSPGAKDAAVKIGLVAAAAGPLIWGFGKAIDAARAVASGLETMGRAYKVAHATMRVYTAGLGTKAKALAVSTAAHVKHAAVVMGQTVKSMALATAAWVKSAAATVASTAALVAHKTISVAVAAGAKLMAAAQWLLNAAMTANPIGLVVAALAALAVGLKYAWDHSATFRQVVTTVFAAVGKAVLTLAEYWLKGTQFMVNAWLSAVGVLLDGAAKMFGWVPGVGPKLKEAADKFRGFKDGVGEMFDGAIRKTQEWKGALDRMPKEVKLRGQIDDLKAKIADARQRLDDPNLTKDRRAEILGEIRDLQRKVATAKADLAAVKATKTVPKIDADASVLNSRAATSKAKLAELGRQTPTPQIKASTYGLDTAVRASNSQLTTLNRQTPTPQIKASTYGLDTAVRSSQSKLSAVDRARPTPTFSASTYPFDSRVRSVNSSLSGVDRRRPTPVISARASSLYGTVRSVNSALGSVRSKHVTISATASVTALQVGYAMRQKLAALGVSGYARGGLVGYVSGPGTGTSDDILARLSNGEYVMRSAAVAKYGRPLFDALNALESFDTPTAAPGRRGGQSFGSAPAAATAAPSVVIHFHNPVIGSREDLARYVTEAQLEWKRAKGAPLGLA